MWGRILIVAVVLRIKLTSRRMGEAVCAVLQLLKGNLLCVWVWPIVPFPNLTDTKPKRVTAQNPLRPDGGRTKTKTKLRSKNLSFDFIFIISVALASSYFG
jgi:hypothetical protein